MITTNSTSTPPPRRPSTKVIALIISNLIFAILAIVFFVKLNRRATDVETLTTTVDTKNIEIATKTKELESLNEDLERIKVEREKLGLQNDSLTTQISYLTRTIEELKSGNQLDPNKRKELDALISRLRREITAKELEIASLKNQNDSLSTNVSSLSTNLRSVSEERVKLSDSLNVKKKELEVASVLKAEDVKVTALKQNGKELDKEEYKAKQIDRIKISFKIADNKAALKNNKTFYVRMITPSGTAFSDANNGGGDLTTKDGKNLKYTFSKALVFDNTKQTIAVTMPKAFDYKEGLYRIEVYCEGYKIGDGGFKVKESKFL